MAIEFRSLLATVLEIFQGIVGKQVGGLFLSRLGILGWKWQVTYDQHKALASYPGMSQGQVRL